MKTKVAHYLTWREVNEDMFNMAMKERNENLELTSRLEASERANSEMREALKPIMFFLQDYLKHTTHPGVSRLLGDAHDALESSTSGQS